MCVYERYGANGEYSGIVTFVVLSDCSLIIDEQCYHCE